MSVKKPQRRPKHRYSPLDSAINSYGCVPVSCIADEWFCELKVDLELGHPEVDRGSEDTVAGVADTTAWDKSRRQHSSLAESADKMPVDAVQKQIRSGKAAVVAEYDLRADFGGLPIGGIPDAVCFENRRAVCVLDYKAKDFRKTPQLFPSDEVQLQLYGLLLERCGLASKALVLACVYFPSSAQMTTLSDAQRQRVPQACWSTVKELSTSGVTSRSAMHHPVWTRSGIRMTRGVTVTVVAVRYHPDDAKKYVDWAAQYWLGKRDPIPTSKPQRCAACRVNATGICSVARAPFGTMR